MSVAVPGRSDPRRDAAAQADPAVGVARVYNGVERAAIVLLTLGDQHGGKLWALMSDDEIQELSQAMASLGPIDPKVVDKALMDFVQRISAAGAVMGSFDSTERLLRQILPKERVSVIMEELRGPAGRTIWEKLSNVQEQLLANYLKNEYPQTVAVVLSKINAEHSARVLSVLPEPFALEVVGRMLKMEPVQKAVLDRLEETLRRDFMSSLAQTRRQDSHEMMAEIFNSFDGHTEARFMTALEDASRDSAERIKMLMFTFEDLGKLDAGACQTLLRYADKSKLAIALKGANEDMRQFFFGNMSSRAAKIMRDDMEALGPTRLKDVEEAQATLISLAKDLAAKGEIMISKNRADDELVY